MNSFSIRLLSIGITVCTCFVPTLFMPSRADTIEPPPGSGAPSGTVGGASRPFKPTCSPPKLSSEPVLIALTSKQKNDLKSLAYAKFGVNLPETPVQAVKLSFLDAQMHEIYQTTISTSQQFGFVTVELPETVPASETEKLYYWKAAFVCHQLDQPESWMASS